MNQISRNCQPAARPDGGSRGEFGLGRTTAYQMDMVTHTDSPPIADYGLIGDLHSCALISKAGSIDWCCLPRFDSASIFGRILDWDKGGYFQVAPTGIQSVERRYIPGTNVLETTFVTDSGTATLTDFMPIRDHSHEMGPREQAPDQQVVRVLECASGSVHYRMECYPRFEYGSIVPHAHHSSENTGFAHGGADAISVWCSAPVRVVDDGFLAEGDLSAGQKMWTVVAYQYRFSHQASAWDEAELSQLLAETIGYWENWSSICTYTGKNREAVLRSALTLKALTYEPSGGLVAAPTTSLPEVIGGSRNWDYRFTWIRDASFALYGLFILGYTAEARAFKEWLEWASAGRARDLQIMYGLGGEKRLTEIELPEMMGYQHSRPVRVGNGAYSQFQLDVYGEILDSAHLYRKFVGEIDSEYWEYLLRVVLFVLDHWREPDEGIWETRAGRQQFVFSKVWCWVALDRAIKAARALHLPGDVDLWRRVRKEIREEILAKGFDQQRGAFVQAYGSSTLDAANLMFPLVGFIKADDPRMLATIRAVESELTSPQGFVYRYKDFDDGLGGDEGIFVICTFWLVDDLILLGEIDRARVLFEKILSYSNDLGLMSEEIDPVSGQMLGNFPQAFSHLGIINTAVHLDQAEKKRENSGSGGS